MTRYLISMVDGETSLRTVAELNASSADAAALAFARRHYRRGDLAVDRISGSAGDYQYGAYVPPNRPWRAENVIGNGFRVSRAAGQFPIARTDPDHPDYQAADAAEEN